MADVQSIKNGLLQWRPPQNWTTVQVLDMHTAGEPLRVYLSGFPEPPGERILARRDACREQLDALRTATLWEPRGHADQYGCLIVPAERDDSDFGVLFLHNEGYSTMCGHAIIAVAKAAVLGGLAASGAPEVSLRIDTPAGQVHAWVTQSPSGPTEVRFRNVPAFVDALDLTVEVPEIGTVQYDLAYGGAWYALVEAASLGLDLAPNMASALIRTGRAIKDAVASTRPIRHPGDPELGFVYGTIFTGVDGDAGWRNACVFADGELDRSPTGTGVSARLAAAQARGRTDLSAWQTFRSIIGSQLLGRVTETLQVSDREAVVTEVRGTAYVTGQCSLLLDPEDPLRNGFFLR